VGHSIPPHLTSPLASLVGIGGGMVWVRGRSYPPSVERMGCFASEARGGVKVTKTKTQASYIKSKVQMNIKKNNIYKIKKT